MKQIFMRGCLTLVHITLLPGYYLSEFCSTISYSILTFCCLLLLFQNKNLVHPYCRKHKLFDPTSYCLTLVHTCSVLKFNPAINIFIPSIVSFMPRFLCTVQQLVMNRLTLDFVFIVAEIWWKFPLLWWHYSLCFTAPIMLKIMLA